VSNDAVREATGRTWSQWQEWLDGEQARDLSHPRIVDLLLRRGRLKSHWWRQQVTVGYEQLIGRRIEGQTADGRFQIGIQRTLPAPAAELWRWLLSAAGRTVWLGESADFEARKGARYTTDAGERGEIRSVAEGRRLRLTWQPAAWAEPSTLQLTLDPRKRGTALRFHHEGLVGPVEREQMRERWGDTLDRVRDGLS